MQLYERIHISNVPILYLILHIFYLTNWVHQTCFARVQQTPLSIILSTLLRSPRVSVFVAIYIIMHGRFNQR